MISKKTNPGKTLKSLNYTLAYKPHRQIAKHMAFYNVQYNDQKIKCPISDHYGVPLNEIWLTEKFKPYEKYILYHELNEIKYRAEGLEPWEAHQKALEKDKIWKDEEEWQHLQKEINIITEEELTKIDGFGSVMFPKFDT